MTSSSRLNDVVACLPRLATACVAPLVLVAGVALGVGGTLGGCGGKPKPKPSPAAATTEGPGGGPSSPSAPAEPEPPPERRTRGGVDLSAALDKAGDAAERIFAAAKKLSRDRAAGVAELLAEKTTAGPTVLALLGSHNFDELIGALQAVGADGDPLGVRAAAGDGVLALLDHEVGQVRDAAWATASKVADGEGLAKLLGAVGPDKKLAVVRLLAAWDGAAIEAALWPLVVADDGALATEAALALSAPGKHPSPELVTRLEALANDGDEARATRGLVMLRRFGVAPSARHKAAIDRALAGKDEALVLEGVRGAEAFALDESLPLFEQLALDPRTAVRATAAEALGVVTGKSRDAAGKAGPLLDKLLADGEGDVRMAAVAARAKVGTVEERLARLTPLTTDAHRGVRLAATVSLASPELIGAALPTLTARLGREERSTQRVILAAMCASGDRAAIGTVIDLIGDPKLAVPAHSAIVDFADGEDFEVDLARWHAWLDKRIPPPPAPANTPTAPATTPPAPPAPKTTP